MADKSSNSSKVFFTPTDKQTIFLEKVFSPEYTYISYGGAAGGGKTIVSLATLVLLCKLYKGSRWCAIRKSLTEIRLNTLPSFWKVCPTNFISAYNKSEFTVTFKNGSQILFKGENIDSDPDLQWMDGLEVNGFLLEQAEELNRKTFDKCKLRAGRWVIDPMPPIKILSTLNPSMSWTKKEIYEPFENGKLEAPYIYIPAKIADNPHLPKQYVDNLKYLDPITYRRFVDGDWTAFAVNNPYAYCFNQDKHIHKDDSGTPAAFEYLKDEYTYLSFDFNVDPITCIASQYVEGQIRIIKEFRLLNSNIYELCDQIKTAFIEPLFLVTGDATGRNRSALATGNINYYSVIKQKLSLNDQQIKTPSINPAHGDGRVLVNSILQHFNISIGSDNQYLIEDLQHVEVNSAGEMDKSKDKHKSHLLDCFIYLLNTFHKDLLKATYIQEVESNYFEE